MSTSVMTPDAVQVQPSRPSRTGRPSRIFALMPLWVFAIVSALSPEFVRDLGADPPSVLGVPLAIVVELGALAWMLVGLVVIWGAASRVVEALALTVFTIPATVVVVVTPLLVDGMLNLA